MTSFSENDGLDRRQSVLSTQRCAASQALLAGRGALGWCTATGTYGHGSLCTTPLTCLQMPAACSAPASCSGSMWWPRQCLAIVTANLKRRAGKCRRWVETCWQITIEDEVCRPVNWCHVRISTCARLRKEIQYCHFLSKSCLKYLVKQEYCSTFPARMRSLKIWKLVLSRGGVGHVLALAFQPRRLINSNASGSSFLKPRHHLERAFKRERTIWRSLDINIKPY